MSSTFFTALMMLWCALSTLCWWSMPLRWGISLGLAFLGWRQGVALMRRAHQLKTLERQLELKLEAAKREIEDNFTRLAQDRLAQVTAEERQRIAADLHDDLGAKLLTIVHTSRDERIAALGREALDEMRLSVRGLTGRPTELAQALADWRSEAMTRVSSAGIALHWPPAEQDHPQMLGARTMVQTTRILREVFNNLIRHSQATRCTVQVVVQADRLLITIGDNGIGFAANVPGHRQTGLGLLNMQHRARQLLGECRLDSQPGQGSQVHLSLPLQAPALEITPQQPA